ncbi:hypothetical protein IJT93_00460 [bacterium]|nr:hypothetical protein [bacterium]
MGKNFAACIVILATCLLLAAGFPKYMYSGDPYWMRAQAWAWLQGRGDIEAEIAEQAEKGQYCFYNEKSGKYYSKYGVMNSAAMLPPLLAGKIFFNTGFNDTSDRRFAAVFNFYNLFLACVLVYLLYLSACLFSRSYLICALWTLAAVFSGFGWNYLRAQSGEIFQWLGACAFFYAACRLWRSADEKEKSLWTYASWIALAFLILLKSLYWLLVPVWWGAILWFAAGESETSEGEKAALTFKEHVLKLFEFKLWRRHIISVRQLLPCAVLLAVFCALNYWRFGGIFNSGYTQWTRESDLFSGNIVEGICGYLFSFDKSIFIYQPLLLLAVWSWPSFYKRFRKESGLILTAFLLLLLVNSKFINWAGHWSYGPRYMLFVVCQLAWPCLLLAEDFVSRKGVFGSALWRYTSVSAAALLLGVSFWLQIQTNSLNFFTYYYAEKYLTEIKAEQALREFHRRPFGIINRDLRKLKSSGLPPSWLNTACQEVPEVQYRLPLALENIVQKNYFWQK